jgi:hypothetical protein
MEGSVSASCTKLPLPGEVFPSPLSSATNSSSALTKAAGKTVSLFMIAERRNSALTVEQAGIVRLKSELLITAKDEDMFGNVLLHQQFALSKPDLTVIRKALYEHPEGAKVKNQFGRIPLHYAMDRTKVDMICFHLLLKIYPEGANEEDDLGCTPYDLSLRWHHSNAILKALLDACPSQDEEHHMKLKWGVIYPLVSLFSAPSRKKSSYSNKISPGDDKRIEDDQGERKSDVYADGSDEGNNLTPDDTEGAGVEGEGEEEAEAEESMLVRNIGALGEEEGHDKELLLQ